MKGKGEGQTSVIHALLHTSTDTYGYSIPFKSGHHNHTQSKIVQSQSWTGVTYSTWFTGGILISNSKEKVVFMQLQMLLISHTCCPLYKCNCVCAFTKSLPAKKLLPTSAGKTHKRSCTFAVINRGRLELTTSPIPWAIPSCKVHTARNQQESITVPYFLTVVCVWVCAWWPKIAEKDWKIFNSCKI